MENDCISKTVIADEAKMIADELTLNINEEN